MVQRPMVVAAAPSVEVLRERFHVEAAEDLVAERGAHVEAGDSRSSSYLAWPEDGGTGGDGAAARRHARIQSGNTGEGVAAHAHGAGQRARREARRKRSRLPSAPAPTWTSTPWPRCKLASVQRATPWAAPSSTWKK